MHSWRDADVDVVFLTDRLDKLESMLEAAIRWIKHDCPYTSAEIYTALEREVDGE
jgi:hypothetical protein